MLLAARPCVLAMSSALLSTSGPYSGAVMGDGESATVGETDRQIHARSERTAMIRKRRMAIFGCFVKWYADTARPFHILNLPDEGGGGQIKFYFLSGFQI